MPQKIETIKRYRAPAGTGRGYEGMMALARRQPCG